MSGIKYDDEQAAWLERFYRGHDVVAQRAEVLRKLDPRPGERVLDIGSGPGFLAEALAERIGPKGRVLGVDISADLVASATARAVVPHLAYEVGDATALACPSSDWDAVACTQVAEYVPDADAVLREAARVLRPGGRALFMATDWGAVALRASDPDRSARVMEAFAGHCAHFDLPRTLAPRLRAAGFASVDVSVFPILNTGWDDGDYGRGICGLARTYALTSGALPADEVKAWHDDVRALGEAGEGWFSSARFLFLARKA